MTAPAQINRILSRIEQIKAIRKLNTGEVGSELVPAERLRIGDRFLFGGRLFDVVDIKPSGEKNFIRVCGEYGANHIDIEYLDIEAVVVQLPRPQSGPRSLR
jgi:hypothetical protein